jgi:hypothetical protein
MPGGEKGEEERKEKRRFSVWTVEIGRDNEEHDRLDNYLP